MAGQAVARLVSRQAQNFSDLSFSLATAGDEPDVRRLLRENALGGTFEITLEREPDAFAGDVAGSNNHAFVLAREASSGQAVGLCDRVVRAAYVDGAARPLPYIGALRVAHSHRRRIGVLRGGFAMLRNVERAGELPFALTSITSDNAVARRLLTAGVPGLPLYRPVGDFSTFALRPRRARVAPDIAPASAQDLPEIARFLQAGNARLQFAPVWTLVHLQALGAAGLMPENFLLARQRGSICGCLAVWDQRAFRQTVIRRYPPWLARLRPLANLAAPLLGLPQFPQPGATLNQAVLSHLAVAEDDTPTFLALVTAALDQAALRGFDMAILGFASARPWRDALRRARRTLEYCTSLYLAHWPEAAAQVAALGTGMPHPELGLL